MEILSKLSTFSDPEQLLRMDVDGFLNFPVYLLWKDREGKYLGCNESLANLVGLSTCQDVLGSTDYELCSPEFAAIYRSDDRKVMLQNKPLITIAPVTMHDGSLDKMITYKLPLRSRENKVVGVIGVCMGIDEACQIDKKSFQPEAHLDSILTSDLPVRQKECVYHLAHGMTIKEIAATMEISPRTVGHYLERVKRKLQCNSRSQLISTLLKGSSVTF